VGAIEYDVVTDQFEKLTRASNLGEADHWDGVVRISPFLSKQQLNETFWHEVCHCIEYVMLNNQLEEDEIACFSRGLYQVVKQLGIEFEGGATWMRHSLR